MNRSRRLELFQLACKKKSFLSPTNRQVTNTKPFRRQSCHCSECGAIGAFQDRQNAQYPQTYIRAHHCKKRKRRLQRRKGTHITSNSLNMGQSQHTCTTIPPISKLRKAKSICFGEQQQLQVQKCKRLLTKDDQQISYKFFYNNELKFSKGFMDASECSSCQPNDAAALLSFINMTKMPTFVLNSLNNTINESRTSSDEEQHQQRVSQKQLTSKIPSVKIKHTSLHSRKLTEGIMHVSVNRTVQKFVKSCTTITLNSTPKPQQKQIVLPSIHSKRDIKQSVYLLSSPRKALFELKCQISSQKKIRVFKK